MGSFELRYDKETDYKYRWTRDEEGVAFKLYVPQAVVPRPYPSRIRVWVETDPRQAASIKANLKCVVERHDELGDTVRYRPVGEGDTWPIGEPYIPKTVLTKPWPQQLHIAVSWVIDS